MKSFKEFCEGRALRITPDMEKFGRDAIKELSKDNWQYGEVVYQREVDGGNYGKRLIKVVPHIKDMGGAGWAEYESGEIGIFAKHGMRYSEDYVDFFIHELIHMFDPKLNVPKLANSKWGIEEYDKAEKPLNANDNDEASNQEYYTSPWEQDAMMASQARDIIRDATWLHDANWKNIQTSLQQMKPQTPAQQAWYKNPKMWRKYLNTVYQELIKNKKGV